MLDQHEQQHPLLPRSSKSWSPITNKTMAIKKRLIVVIAGVATLGLMLWCSNPLRSDALVRVESPDAGGYHTAVGESYGDNEESGTTAGVGEYYVGNEESGTTAGEDDSATPSVGSDMGSTEENFKIGESDTAGESEPFQLIPGDEHGGSVWQAIDTVSSDSTMSSDESDPDTDTLHAEEEQDTATEAEDGSSSASDVDSAEPMAFENGNTNHRLLDLGETAQSKYQIPVHPSEEYTTSFYNTLVEFIDILPSSLRTNMLRGLASHQPPQLTDILPTVKPLPFRPMILFPNIFQTDRHPPGEWTQQWENMNAADGWQVDYYEDPKAEEWVEEQFTDAEAPEAHGVLWAWKYMKRGVLHADFLRYLLPLIKGGVYTDSDTTPLRPIMEWGRIDIESMDVSATDGPDWKSKQGYEPQVVVGLEVDVHEKMDWFKVWPRALGICQWTLGSAPHHPIFLEVVRRIVNATEVVARAEENTAEPQPRDLSHTAQAIGVLDWTGPGVFTDSVLAYLMARYNVTWHQLRGLEHPLRIGEVLILPTAAFSPGGGGNEDFHAPGLESPQCALIHHFWGSWKGDGL